MLDLIKLSTVLYPSLPGPRRRPLEVKPDPIEPYYFEDASAGRFLAVLWVVSATAAVYVAWKALVWLNSI